MELERWVDLSKWQGDVAGQSLRAMKSDGVKGICVGSWHGISPNPYVRNVLRRSRDVGLDTATYYVFNSRGGKETVERAIAACGQVEWDACIFHAPDIEIRGVTEQILRDGLKATEDAGGWPIIYTGNWFWNWWKLDLGHAPDFTNWPSWIAVYNGRPDLNVTPAWGLGTLRIHQYTGSTQAYGTTVDFNTASKAWMDLARARAMRPEPVKEDAMTDTEKAAFVALEVKVAKLEENAHDPPQFIRKESDPTVFMLTGGFLFSVRDGATWQKLKDLGYGRSTTRLPDDDPIWKSPRMEF